MRVHEATARRYAKALHGAARESGSTEAFSREIEGFLRAIAGHREVQDVLARPWIKPEDRRGIALALAEKLGCAPIVRRFVGLVAERGRMGYFPEIVTAYRALVDEDLGQARAQVRATVALTDD